MSQAITTAAQSAGEIIESVIVKGDLSKLTPAERSRYYMEVCKSVGLNPLTKPFEYITLNGKLTLYALRACTDQLRTIHGVSVEELAESEREGVFIVTAKVKNKEGRTDISKGAVTISGLKGEALANAMMKAETKAKRRATLSVCGLGFLDETEIETIPASAKGPSPSVALPAAQPIAPRIEPPHDPNTGEIVPHIISVPTLGDHQDWIGWGGSLIAALKTAKTRNEAGEWIGRNAASLDACAEKAPKAHGSIMRAYNAIGERLPDVDDVSGTDERVPDYIDADETAAALQQ